MTLRALSLQDVKAMDKRGREKYFFAYAGYFPDSPAQPYAIRVGSKTFHSNDTADLRQQFDKYLRYAKV